LIAVAVVHSFKLAGAMRMEATGAGIGSGPQLHKSNTNQKKKSFLIVSVI
jgi:hypothetical protein